MEMCGNFLKFYNCVKFSTDLLHLRYQGKTAVWSNPNQDKGYQALWVMETGCALLRILPGPLYEPPWKPTSWSQFELKATQQTMMFFLPLRLHDSNDPLSYSVCAWSSWWLARTSLQRCASGTCHHLVIMTRHNTSQKQLLACFWVLVKTERLNHVTPLTLQHDVPSSGWVKWDSITTNGGKTSQALFVKLNNTFNAALLVPAALSLTCQVSAW